MKNLLLKLFALSTLMVFTGIQGQKTSKYKKKSGPDFKFGALVGANYANINGWDSSADPKFIFGINAGMYTYYQFSEKIGLQLEATYTNFGSDVKFETAGTTLKERLDYIAIPLLLKPRFDNFYITAGPQLLILVSAKENGHDIKESLNTTDFGLTGGLGYYFTENFGIDLRYTHGMSDIVKDSTFEKLTNNAFAGRLFYQF
ncbi:porin family protein [Chryseobacterium koreense]|uniref:porin family protein n=1 Tax=Chryseobacterium koreense TaxID=232216 RepID=UPI000A06EA1A|nr:porin family protein [Chryseobacterium koreense]MBB5334541.1 hypothetical protein [Chryseobacterium koreense]